MLPSGKSFAVSANMGFYSDKQAFAAQSAIRLTDALTLNGGIGVGLSDTTLIGGRVGLTAAW